MQEQVWSTVEATNVLSCALNKNIEYIYYT